MTHSTLGRKASRERNRKMNHQGPRTSTVQAILGYSRALKVVEAPPLGEITLVLN